MTRSSTKHSGETADQAEASAFKHHAALDLDSRRLKAIKIERLLDLKTRPQPLRMLEIGTGSGGIAHYFGKHPDLRIEVDSLDVVDTRTIKDGYRFQLVKGTRLPFPDSAFDVVLSNHVIEHVGDREAQLQHLCEIRRVLRDDGVGYLAVPNRWMLVEPHYNLAFLSWWPHDWRSRYLKLCRGVFFYDIEPLTVREAETLFHESGFSFENLCIAAFRQTLDLEYAPVSAMRRFFAVVPDRFITPLLGIIPTLIYRFVKAR
jgi:SAM-dependent methyltransferase